MKFTKKQAYENIVSRLTPNGETLSLSERSINDQLETLIPLLATDETELDDFVNKCFPVFKTANANINNDVSSGINKYKKEHPIDTPPVKKNEKEGEEKDELAEWMKKINARFEKEDKEKEILAVKTSLKSSLKEKGVNQDWIDTTLGLIALDGDVNVEDKAKELVGIYNKQMAVYDHDATPFGGAGGGDAKKRIDDFISEAADYAKKNR